MFNMFKFKCNSVFCCIGISIWTLIQTAIHICGIIYVIWLRDCRFDENEDYLLYLTYFFTRRCENETITSLMSNRRVILIRTETENVTNTTTLSSALDSLIFAYLVLDALWIVASVALMTGACFKIKERWALLFYVPWIVVAAVIVIFDAFCSIFFGLNVPDNGSFFEWLGFIGIPIRLNGGIEQIEGDVPTMVVGVAAAVMTLISARGVLVWIINLILIYFVVRAAKEAVTNKDARSTASNTDRSSRYRMSSNAERIRKWNQFYGSSESDTKPDENSTRRRNIFGDGDGSSDVDNASSSGINSNDLVEVYSNNSEDLRTAEGRIDAKNVADAKDAKVSLRELRSQLPWSYVNGKGGSVETVRPDVRNKKYFKDHRGKDDEAVSKF